LVFIRFDFSFIANRKLKVPHVISVLLLFGKAKVVQSSLQALKPKKQNKGLILFPEPESDYHAVGSLVRQQYFRSAANINFKLYTILL